MTRLTPPPRLPRPSGPSTRRSRTARGRRGSVPSWVALLLLAALGSGAFAVFTLLPAWVESREPSSTPGHLQPDGPDVADDSDMPDGTGPLEGEPPATGRPPVEAHDPRAVASARRTPLAETPAEPSPRPSQRPEPSPSSNTGPSAAAAADPVEESFREALSDGLAALEEKDWAAAREALERARSMRPEAPQVADALARLETGETIAALGVFQRQARQHEEAERWRRAEASYRAALALDPTVAFAREGLARATARAEMAETLRYHLDHPERLSSLAVLEEVSALLDRAREVEPAGPEHRRRVAELSQRVTEWAQPVTARLVSDGQTRVTLYRVGTLGTFTRQEIELRPGTYTAVGQRPGYRDVRRKLVIRPGQPPEPLRVICEEEI